MEQPEQIAVSIVMNLKTGEVQMSLPTDLLMTLQLIHAAQGEVLKKAITERTSPKNTNPGVLVHRPGMHMVKG